MLRRLNYTQIDPRSRIHERTISLRLLGTMLRVLRLLSQLRQEFGLRPQSTPSIQSLYFYTFKEPRNSFQGIDSASIVPWFCSVMTVAVMGTEMEPVTAVMIAVIYVARRKAEMLVYIWFLYFTYTFISQKQSWYRWNGLAMISEFLY